MKILADPEHDQPENRMNDGKCDPAGRFWAGTMDMTASIPNQGSQPGRYPASTTSRRSTLSAYNIQIEG